ncbi:MAG: medium chain dehydrogenase/reductase family protein [Myxococcota bacterium]
MTIITARRVRIDQAGSYDRLRIETLELAPPGPNDVTVSVRAAGVNYADVIVRMGLYASAREFVGWPITPGFEVAGEVVAVGSEVSDLRPGDRVIGVTLFNGYASAITLPRAQIFALPEALSFEQGASLPAIFVTAHFALHSLAHPRPGERVLVHSAAGGVGGCLVQLAKRIGCEVTGVVGRTHKVEVARAFGCDHVIDKSRERLWRRAERIAPAGFDVILDANGVATLGESYAHLASPGKLVVYGFATMLPRGGARTNYLKLAADYLRTPRFNPLDMTNESKSVLAFNLSYLFDRQDLLQEAMADIRVWLDSGAIVAPPVQSFALDRVADAHRAIESGETIGKLVLVP